MGFSSCHPWALSCSMAHGIFLDQGSNPCLLDWQANSLPLSHQENPHMAFKLFLSVNSSTSFKKNGICLENQSLSLSSSVADCTPNNLLFPVYPVNISWAVRPGGLVSQVQKTFIFEGEGGTRCFISDGVCFLLHHIRKQSGNKSGNKSGCYMGRSEWLGSSLITSCTHLLYRNGSDTRTSPYTVLESIDNFGLYLGLSYLMTCRLSLFC